jgi:hypothetical protein
MSAPHVDPLQSADRFSILTPKKPKYALGCWSWQPDVGCIEKSQAYRNRIGRGQYPTGITSATVTVSLAAPVCRRPRS